MTVGKEKEKCIGQFWMFISFVYRKIFEERSTSMTKGFRNSLELGTRLYDSFLQLFTLLRMSLDLIHYGLYSAWRKNALLIQKIRVLNASEIHEAYFARDLPQGETTKAIEAFNEVINKWDPTILVDKIATHGMGLYSVTPPNKQEAGH